MLIVLAGNTLPCRSFPVRRRIRGVCGTARCKVLAEQRFIEKLRVTGGMKPCGGGEDDTRHKAAALANTRFP